MCNAMELHKTCVKDEMRQRDAATVLGAQIYWLSIGFASMIEANDTLNLYKVEFSLKFGKNNEIEDQILRYGLCYFGFYFDV